MAEIETPKKFPGCVADIGQIDPGGGSPPVPPPGERAIPSLSLTVFISSAPDPEDGPMKSFLQLFYEQIDDFLGDPKLVKRLPHAKRYEMLRVAETQIWEKLVRTVGHNGSLGRAEATITLQDDVRYYRLPGNFRKFIEFVHRNNGDPNEIINRLRTIPMSSPGPGIELLNANRGMVIRPNPVLPGDEDWTLVYEKGPVLTHYAQAEAIGDQHIKFGTPGDDAGELILNDDYYNGSMVEVYEAETGNLQTIEIEDFVSDSKTAYLRFPWSPKPTGETIMYQIRPVLPENYSNIYALRVAALYARSQGFPIKARSLDSEFNAQFAACAAYFASQTFDRAPSRHEPTPSTMQAVDIYEDW